MKNSRKNTLSAWCFSMGLLFMLTSCGGDADKEALATRFNATLTSEQEVPPTASQATGTGMAAVNPDTREMNASVNTAGLAGTAAHIHEGARGINGPVIFPMTQTSPGSGVWIAIASLSDAQLTTLRAGNYYFNVHSAVFPNGEIRGQIEIEKILDRSRVSSTTTVAGTTTTTTGVGTTSSTTTGITTSTTGMTTTTTVGISG